MRFAVPLNAAGEAEILFKAGADEFYCGVMESGWRKKFGDHDGISRRQGAANIGSRGELKIIIEETAALGAPLFLTLNGSYTDEQLPFVAELAEFFEHNGGAGLMLMDVSLLVSLLRRGSRLKRGISLLAAVSSPSALGFYGELGADRVVLPRFLNFNQMKDILSGYPGVEAEAIVWIDKCRFIDGYCRFIHSVGYAGRETGEAACREIYSHDTTYTRPACSDFFGGQPRGPACAACALKPLAAAGVKIYKLGGRGRPLETRLNGVKFLKAAGELSNDGERREFYRRFFGSPCDAEVCYYGTLDKP